MGVAQLVEHLPSMQKECSGTIIPANTREAKVGGSQEFIFGVIANSRPV